MFSAWKLFIELRKENSLPVPFDLHLWLAKGCEGLLFFYSGCVSCVSVERRLSFISLVKLGFAEWVQCA